MSDADLLLAAIRVSPAEDVRRLAYADHLDENGEHERAWFIRSEIAIAQAGGKAQTVVTRTPSKGIAILRPWMQKELEPLCVIPHWDVMYTRGFVSGIGLSCVDFLDHAPLIFGAYPMTDVWLPDREPIDGSAWSRGAPAFRPRGGPLRPRRLTDEQIRRAGIPSVIFSHLPGVTEYMNWRDFTDPWAALCIAGVAYGRTLVGLPPLPPE